MPRRPVFLHTGWRTAGTWLWTRMRDDPSVIGFYEPLNEALAGIGPGDIREFRSDAWESRHPFQERSYYEEFAPFLRRWRRGIARYDERFALDGWFGGMDDVPRGLHSYIAMLLDHAEVRGRVAAFKFARSLGRLAWMTRTFSGAAHIVVVRNPLDQWCSGWHQATAGNPYFVIMPWLALHRNAGSAAIASTASLLDVTPLDFGRGPLQRQYDCAAATIAGVDPAASYRAFLVTWILGMVDALRFGEIVVDIDALHDDDAYRPGLERSIEQHTGIHVDFGTFDTSRSTAHHAVANDLDLDLAHDRARRAIAAICDTDDRARDIARRCVKMLDRSVMRNDPPSSLQPR